MRSSVFLWTVILQPLKFYSRKVAFGPSLPIVPTNATQTVLFQKSATLGGSALHCIKLCSICQKTTSFDRNLSFSVIFAFRRVICPSARDICFASDMPAGVSGEYNITETPDFNITFCASKIYHSVVDGISLKTNDYVRVRIHTKKQQKYLFRSP